MQDRYAANVPAAPAPAHVCRTYRTRSWQVARLPLVRLTLAGVRLGDKGVAQLAEGLRANSTLQELDLSRTGTCDAGGAVLLDALGGNYTLTKLDLRWGCVPAPACRGAHVGGRGGGAGSCMRARARVCCCALACVCWGKSLCRSCHWTQLWLYPARLIMAYTDVWI